MHAPFGNYCNLGSMFLLNLRILIELEIKQLLCKTQRKLLKPSLIK